MQVITEAELLDRIRSFLLRHEMAPTTFGRNATGEPQLISSIEGGRSPSLKVVGKVEAYMARVEATAKLRPPPLELTAPPEGQQLPFYLAPAANPTGASSPISSPTSAAPVIIPDGGTCRSCSSPDEDWPVRRPSTKTPAG